MLDPPQVLYISMRTPNAVQNMLFQSCCAKKLKKEEKARNSIQNLAKNTFLVCTKTLVRGFIPRKTRFWWCKHVFTYKKL